jgi:hypothetical protein
VTRPDNSDDYEFPPVSMIERSDQSTLDADFDDEITIGGPEAGL